MTNPFNLQFALQPFHAIYSHGLILADLTNQNQRLGPIYNQGSAFTFQSPQKPESKK